MDIAVHRDGLSPSRARRIGLLAWTCVLLSTFASLAPAKVTAGGVPPNFRFSIPSDTGGIALGMTPNEFERAARDIAAGRAVEFSRGRGFDVGPNLTAVEGRAVQVQIAGPDRETILGLFLPISGDDRLVVVSRHIVYADQRDPARLAAALRARYGNAEARGDAASPSLRWLLLDGGNRSACPDSMEPNAVRRQGPLGEQPASSTEILVALPDAFAAAWGRAGEAESRRALETGRRDWSRCRLMVAAQVSAQTLDLHLGAPSAIIQIGMEAARPAAGQERAQQRGPGRL